MITFMQVVTLDDIYASSDIRYRVRFISIFFVLTKKLQLKIDYYMQV